MRARAAIAGLLAVLLCAAPTCAAPPPPAAPSAPALLSGISQLNQDLALLGSAQAPFGLSHGKTFSELRLENGDGYDVSVIGFGQTVALVVKRGQGANRATTTYLTHGRVTPTSIRASFADRGSIDVHFEPSTRRVLASRHAGCRRASDDVLARLGVFAGKLDFRGEGGYTTIEAHRVRGRLVDFTVLVACVLGISPNRSSALPAAEPPLGLPPAVAPEARGGAEVPAVPTHPSPRPKRTTLFADGKLPLAQTEFAAQTDGTRPVRFLAEEGRSEGSIGIIRFVSATGPRSSFSADDALSAASVSPPRPFAGTGSFQRAPGGGRNWSGSLAVSFLGAPRVPLTGPPIGARLTRSW